MNINWLQFHLDDSLFELWCHSDKHNWAATKDSINLFCMIDNDVLICKVFSPIKSDIVDMLHPIFANYNSVTFVENYAISSGGFLSLMYFQITDPSEIVQFKLTYS